MLSVCETAVIVASLVDKKRLLKAKHWYASNTSSYIVADTIHTQEGENI